MAYKLKKKVQAKKYKLKIYYSLSQQTFFITNVNLSRFFSFF